MGETSFKKFPPYPFKNFNGRGKEESPMHLLLSLVGTGLPDGPLKRYKTALRTVEDAGPYERDLFVDLKQTAKPQ